MTHAPSPQAPVAGTPPVPGRARGWHNKIDTSVRSLNDCRARRRALPDNLNARGDGHQVTIEDKIIGPLTSLRDQSPSGFVISLHIRFMSPTYIFLTYPPAWRDIYSRHGYIVSDPTIRWGLAHTGHVSWARLAEDDPAGVLAQAAAHGMRHGLTIALGQESRSLGSFTRPDRDYDAAETARLVADFEALHAHTATLAQLSPETGAVLHRLSVTGTHP